jgi:RNA polymerase sigma-70 factor (ECF subfamily)
MSKVVPIAPRTGPAPRASLEDCSDDELMLLMRGGATTALRVLAARHLVRLQRFCTKFLRDPHAADDVVQETWLRIWSLRSAYRPEGKFVVLLFTSARNLCRNHARSTQRRAHWLPSAGPTLDLELLADAQGDHLSGLIERERQRAIESALHELPEAMVEALLLRFSEALSYEDIARIVGAPESTVRSRVFHGLKQLRARVLPGEQP